MPLRLLRPALAAVLLVLAVPTVASAAGAALRSPADGVVTGAVVIEVRVATEAGDALERIGATLRHVDGDVDGGVRHLLCDDPGTCSRTDAGYDIEFDPNTGAPFVDEARTLPNGGYVLRLHLTRPHDTVPETLDLRLTLSAPGSAVADLAADAAEGEVTLSWGAAREPDVNGYLVERLAPDGWTTLVELPAEATSSTDRPPPGHHAYRVGTLRPDGRGATYETVSREVALEVGDAADPPVGADTEPGPGGSGADPAAGRADREATSEERTSRSATPEPGAGRDDPAPPGDEPLPQGSATDRAPGAGSDAEERGRYLTVTEDGELVVAARDVGPGPRPAATTLARYALALIGGSLFLGLGVRTRRRSRRAAPRQA